jgi:hypothetical protein
MAQLVMSRGAVGGRASAYFNPDVIIGEQKQLQLRDGIPVATEAAT